MTERTAAGYSGTPLIRKFGIRENSRILAVSPPPDYAQLLGDLPPGASFASRKSSTVDMVHLFAVRRAELERQLRKLTESLRPDAAIWVS